MTKCKNCGADEGLHNSMTDQCPVGGVEAPFGKPQQWKTSVYHPILTRASYPVDGNTTVANLTIRQHFAGLAMQGLLANPHMYADATDRGVFADAESLAVEAADALIAELNKTNE